MSQTIPNKFYILKDIYDNFNIKYTPTRDILDIGVHNQKLYYINNLLESTLWHDNLYDYNGNKVQAIGAKKRSRYWRISGKSLDYLFKYFNIETDLDILAKYHLENQVILV